MDAWTDEGAGGRGIGSAAVHPTGLDGAGAACIDCSELCMLLVW